MKKLYFLTLTLFLMLSATTMAQGLYVDYCGKNLPNGYTGHVDGMTGKDASYDLAIHLTPSELNKFAGNKITKVIYGIAEGSAPADGIEMTGWVRNASDNMGQNIAEGKVVAKDGWNVITLTTPIAVTSESDLYIGVTYTQSTKENIICFAGTPNAEGCYTRKTTATKWSNWTSKNWGSLCIRAMIEGENLPKHDIALTNVRVGRSITKIGEPIRIKGTIVNNASAVAAKPEIVCRVDGKQTYVYSCTTDLAYEDTEDFTIDVPNSVSDENDHDIELEARWANGSTDDYTADNTAALKASFAKDVFYRKMVVEEGTGTWCGFCVRGYVAMKMMAEKYPESFIGIAVHSGDELSYAPYDNWISSIVDGYPSCLINRDGNVYDPSIDELEYCISQMDEVAKAGIKVSGTLDAESDLVSMTAEVTPAFTSTNEDLRVVFVIREDGVNAKQKNYYAGGGYGPLYGFEDMPSTCTLPMYDIARTIVPDMNGVKGSIPASVEKGKTYTYTHVAKLPTSIVDTANINVVAILINANTGEIVNGETSSITTGTNEDAISSIAADKASNGQIYDLSGRRVMNPKNGIYVQDGKVRIIK